MRRDRACANVQTLRWSPRITFADTRVEHALFRDGRRPTSGSQRDKSSVTALEGSLARMFGCCLSGPSLAATTAPGCSDDHAV